jgi:nicotinate-nucleotide adenylyltransferase
MDIDNPELLEKIRKFALASEKPDRYEHSERVAETAMIMCDMFGVDPKKGYLAGLAHDMCKDMDDKLLLSLASHDDQPITPAEKEKPSLLHGRAAAVKLETDFGVNDTDIIQAVSRHTLGGASMCPLAKILFVADKIEPGRPQSTKEYRAKLFDKSLNEICLAVLDENTEYLRSKGKSVAPVTLRFRESLKRDIAGDAQIAMNMDRGE